LHTSQEAVVAEKTIRAVFVWARRTGDNSGLIAPGAPPFALRF
jgi:hypothetical protein